LGYTIVNETGSVCDQKTSKFLSHGEESMARLGCKWNLLKVREGKCPGGS
jgi:hypothetical protein